MKVILSIIIIALPIFLTLGIVLLLSRLLKKLNPFFQRIGSKMGMILFKKRREREREYMESLNIAECLKENFCLPIDEVVTMAGVGTVVVGTVEAGICREEEQAYLEQEGGRLDTILGHIDLETLRRKPDGKAYRTEHIAVHLRGVSEKQVKAGDKLIIENANLHHESKGV